MKARRPYALAILAMLCVVQVASALPRFANRTASKCQSCHVNPSGGGMRNPFGVQYGRDELPVPTWAGEYALDDFSTQLTEFVAIGADFRTLFFYQQTSGPSTNAFFQMQGDVYLNFRIAKKVSMYLDKGLYSGFEIFGLLNILPGSGHIKAGRFVPNYGIKMDEHRAFVREQTGFSPEAGQPFYTGGEIGFSPGPVSITGGIYNAVSSPGVTTDKNKAFLGRVEAIFKAGSDAGVGIGGNAFYKDVAGTKTTLLGGFGSFGYADFTLLGEADLIKTKTAVATVDGLALFAEANYVLTPGFDVKLMYDFFDRDIDLKTGSMSRYSVGFEFFPISGVEVRPLYRILKEEPTEVNNNEFHLLIHFYL